MSNTGYETAPSTIMIATHCVCCARPLRDAVSVERGVGPDCAEKYGYAEAQGEADWAMVDKAVEALLPAARAAIVAHLGFAHKMANVAVHYAACSPAGERAIYAALIYALGYARLAEAVAKSAGEVIVVKVDGEGEDARYIVSTPFSRSFNLFMHMARVGAYFCPVRKAWNAPVSPRARLALWAGLRETFPGLLIATPKGVSRLPTIARAS